MHANIHERRYIDLATEVLLDYSLLEHIALCFTLVVPYVYRCEDDTM